MKHLRKYIRNIIKEVWDIKKEDPELYAQVKDQMPDPDEARASGLQAKEEIEEERTILQDYQSKIDPEFVEAFRNGTEVTILHSVIYKGYAEYEGHKKGPRPTSLSDWIGKFGKSGNDVLSTIALPTEEWFNYPGQPIPKYGNGMVMTTSGFQLKGYPVIVSKQDVMSQTLGALPSKLVKHQAQSGVAKRAGARSYGDFMYNMDELIEHGIAEEVLLDNWEITGCFFCINPQWDKDDMMAMIEDVQSTGFGKHVIVFHRDGKRYGNLPLKLLGEYNFSGLAEDVFNTITYDYEKQAGLSAEHLQHETFA